MKTKYIKVAVSDELPKESGKYSTSLGECEFHLKWSQFYHIGLNLACNPEYFFEEVPDHEAELVDEIRTSIDQLEVYISELEEDDKYWGLVNIMKKEIELLKESLIQKLKSDE